MRHVKTTLSAGIVLGALFMATPALATEFFAERNPNACSETAPCQTVGLGFGTADEQHPGYAAEFQLGAFNVLCQTVHARAKTPAEGAFTTESSETLKIQVTFGKCLTVARFGQFSGGFGTVFNGGKPMTLEYKPNEALPGEVEGGTVQLGEERVSVKISHGICKIGWGGQVVKSKKERPVATFANQEQILAKPTARFPEGIRKRLEITNTFNGLEFEYEEGQCVGEGGFEEGASKTEGKSGKFEAKVLLTVPGGSISAE